MIDVLTGFVGELRAAGLPVSLTETLDAAEAVGEVPLDDRELLRAALGATLVKRAAHYEAFTTLFDLYFSIRTDSSAGLLDGLEGSDASQGAEATEAGGGARSTGPTEASRHDADNLRAEIAEALRTGDSFTLAALARRATELFGGVEATRPVGVSYYLHKTLRGLDLDGMLAGLLANARASASGAPDEVDDEDPLVARLVADELSARAAELRRLIEAEIRRLLVEERGAAAVAKTLRRPLVEDVDFMHATSEEMVRLRRALDPLARALAVRLARRRRHRRHGALDFRSTIRRSLSTGGVPLEPRFHRARPAKPEIVVLADVSGSVASFARFTLQLVYAMASQFSKVRTFVFVDGIDEVTTIFERASSLDEAIARVGAEADVIDHDGHSDYGNAFGLFAQRWAGEITSRTNVIVLGDARNNYHAANAQALGEIADRARHVFWLNPEPRAYWGSGDSIVEAYAPLVERVHECRNLRQLERFVDLLA